MKCPPELKELLKVLYGLSGSETQVLYLLCGEEFRVSEIAEELDRDRSTVQRYLSKLRTAGLVERESRAEEAERGRYYVYSVPDKERLKQTIEEKMEEWKKEKMEALEEM